MKKAKTGIEVLGPNLFTDVRAADKELRKLPKAARTYLQRLRREWPDAGPDRLRELLRAAFAITPLVIGNLQSIRIEVEPRSYLNEYRCWMSGHLHEAVVPFEGDLLFWRHQPTTGTKFLYRGKVGPSTVRLRTFVDGENYDWFKADVEKALRHAREELAMTENGQRLIAEQARSIIDQVFDELTG